MKTAVVIDSACDLSAAYIQQHRLYLLPNKLVVGNQILIDNRDVNLTLAFYHRYASAQPQNLAATSEPASVGAIVDLFLNRLVTAHDRAILITISQTRSELFQNATEASFAIVRGYRERRQQAGLNTPFHLNVLDSRTVFAGQAVLAHEVVRLLQNPDLPFGELRRLAEAFRRYIRCYILLDDLAHVYRQASEKGERSIGFLNYRMGALLGLKPVARFVDGETELVLKARGFERALAGLFEQANLEIDQGLRSPLVVLSYAGDPQWLRRQRAFIDFERHIRQWGIELMVSVMSATGGLYLGPNAVSLAFAVA